jgi:Protein of unknown function (DUF3037)
MDDHGFYALAQISPAPERLEFVNFGVLLFLPAQRVLLSRFSSDPRRMRAVFGSGARDMLEIGAEGLKSRLDALVHAGAGVSELEAFARNRVNEVRLSGFLPVSLDDAAAVVDRLFAELVLPQVARATRRPRMARVLKEAFSDAAVLDLLQSSPPLIVDPQTGLKIKASFGYQNGAYNLIEGLKVDQDPAETAAQAGLRATEGRVLRRLYEETGTARHLVVVGDFAESSSALYDDLADSLERDGVTLRRLDQLAPLYDDIRLQARVHGTGDRA